MTEAEVQEPRKKITRDEMRSLERIIKSDFNTLRSEIEVRAVETLQREEEAIRAKFREQTDQVSEAQGEIRKLAEECREKLAEKMRELKGRGFVPAAGTNYTPSGRPIHNSPVVEVPLTFEVTGLVEELQKMKNKVLNAKAQAIADLNRQENEAMRTLTLSNVVSDEAKELLDSFPTADQVLAQALSAVTARATQPQYKMVASAPR